MKKKMRTICGLLAAVFLFLSLPACRREPEPVPVDWSLYTIVTPPEGPGLDPGMSGPGIYSARSAMSVFLEKVEELGGKRPAMNSDLSEPAEYEILLGDCSRPDYRKILTELQYNDYMILRVGNRFYIAAYTQPRRTAAVSKFMELMPTLTADGPDGIIARAQGTYKARNMTLNGTDIREYVIVYENTVAYSPELRDVAGYYMAGLPELLYSPHIEAGAVNLFDYYIVSYCGYRLRSIGKSEYLRHPDRYPHAIMFGSCGGVSSGLSPSGDGGYQVISDGNNVAIAGADLRPASSSLLGETFARDYFGASPVIDGVMQVNIPEGLTSGVLNVP